MPVSDSRRDRGQNGSVLSPSLTDVLRRRVFALLIDVGLVGLVSAFVARTQLESFTPTGFDGVTGDPIFSAADFERMEVLRGEFNRLIPWGGDTVNVIGQTGFILLAFVTLLTAALVFLLLPANAGWTPGQKLLRLRTVDESGDDIGLPAHAIRTLVGIVDGFPWFLPGLLGWLIARNDIQHRRLGDRVAKTLVVDATAPITFVDAATLEAREQRQLRRKEARVAADVPASADLDSMVDLGNRLSSEVAAPDFGNPPPPGGLPEPDFDAAGVFDTPGALDTSGALDTTGGFAPSPFDAAPPVADAVPMADAEAAVTVGDSTPPFAIDLGIADAPTTPFDATPPAEATPVAEVPRERAPRPQHRTPPQHRSSVSQPSAAPAIADQPTVDYESPVASTAPVWTPGSEPAPTDFSTEPSPAVAARQAAAPAPAPNPEDVVWNDQWQAWLYWDPQASRWLRHEPQRNVWIPIS